MAKEKLPRLTEAHIRKLASEPSFERGRDYYQEGDILEPVRQERELRAQCEGSAYEPYQVSATLADEGIDVLFLPLRPRRYMQAHSGLVTQLRS